MPDEIRKILEQVVSEWLRKHFQGTRAMSADQYEFQASCSTIDVDVKLNKFAASAIKKHQFGVAVSLNIQNAFNSMPWTHILEALVNAKVPVYLDNITWDYFWDQVVLAQTALGMVKKEMICGVLQGSILGPLL